MLSLYRPLHGIPILIKDVAATLDKIETAVGSTVLLGTRCLQKARLFEHLTNVRDTLKPYNPPKADLSRLELTEDPLRGSSI
jgi:hypothetical protein